MKIRGLNKFHSMAWTRLTAAEEKKQQERADRIAEGITSLLQSHRPGFLVQHPDEQKNTGAWKRTEPNMNKRSGQAIEYQWDWISTYSGVAVRFDQKEVCVSPDHPSECSHRGPCFPWGKLGNYFSRNTPKISRNVQLKRRERVCKRNNQEMIDKEKIEKNCEGKEKELEKSAKVLFADPTMKVRQVDISRISETKHFEPIKDDTVEKPKVPVRKIGHVNLIQSFKVDKKQVDNKDGITNGAFNGRTQSMKVVDANFNEKFNQLQKNEKELKDLAEKVKEYLRAVRGTETDVEKKKILEDVPVRMSKDKVNRQKFRLLHCDNQKRGNQGNERIR